MGACYSIPANLRLKDPRGWVHASVYQPNLRLIGSEGWALATMEGGSWLLLYYCISSK